MSPSILPVAGLDGDTIAAITVPMCIFAIPVVAILTRHQQRMAQLMHGQQENPHTTHQNDQMRQDIARLTQAVSALTMTVDNLKDRIERSDSLSDRVQTKE